MFGSRENKSKRTSTRSLNLRLKSERVERERESTVGEVEERGELELRRRLVSGAKPTGQEKPRESPDECVGQEVAFQRSQHEPYSGVVRHLHHSLHLSLSHSQIEEE